MRILVYLINHSRVGEPLALVLPHLLRVAALLRAEGVDVQRHDCADDGERWTFNRRMLATPLK